MKEIESSDNIKHKQTIEQASGLKGTLQDDDFIFWLNLFHKIMPHVDILYNQLQKRKTDSVYIKTCIERIVKVISSVRTALM